MELGGADLGSGFQNLTRLRRPRIRASRRGLWAGRGGVPSNANFVSGPPKNAVIAGPVVHDRRMAPADSMYTDGTLVSVGYEGKTVGDLVAQLLEQGVRALVDVRLTPLSRKPGLSKTKLAAALHAAGIEYVHHRALGNPKDNRAGFRAGTPESMERYREVLETAAAGDALAHVSELLDGGAVALLCFEQDHAECHRNVVVDRVLETRPNAAVVHV